MTSVQRTQKRHAAEHPMAPYHKHQRYNQYQENYQRRRPNHRHNQHQKRSQYRQRFQTPSYEQPPAFYREPLRELAPPTFDAKMETKQSTGSFDDILAYIPLLKSLQSQGFLAPTTSSVPEPPKPRTEDDIWAALAPRAQRIKDQSKIDALLEKRPDQCSICCLKVVKGSEEWKEHMTYHFEVNMGDMLQRKPKYLKREQPWYSGYLAGCKPAEEVKPIVTLDVEAKGSGKCTVCWEKFKEYYDDDEEMWRYKDSVEKNGQIVHKNCSDNCPDAPIEEHKPIVDPEIIYL